MVTQTIYVGDCELLERYMDVTDAANPKWANWENRKWLEGLNTSATFPNPFTGRLGNTRVHRRLARAHAACDEPAVRHRRCGHRARGPGRDGEGPLDALGGRAQRLWRRSGRLRAPDVGQRRRPIRAEGAGRRAHHAGRVPEPERHGRLVEGSRPDDPGGRAVRAGRDVRPVEHAQPAPEPGRRGDAGAAPGLGRSPR